MMRVWTKIFLEKEHRVARSSAINNETLWSS